MRLYDWKAECLKNRDKNRFRGIANVVTGAGKTVLALAAIQRLEEHLSNRHFFTRHMLANTRNHVFIIADECHHYGTAENSRIFGFIKVVPNFSSILKQL